MSEEEIREILDEADLSQYKNLTDLCRTYFSYYGKTEEYKQIEFGLIDKWYYAHGLSGADLGYAFGSGYDFTRIVEE